MMIVIIVVIVIIIISSSNCSSCSRPIYITRADISPDIGYFLIIIISIG